VEIAMQCKDVMLTLVYGCSRETTAEACAELMREKAVGFVPVTDPDGRLVGVITDRDLVLRVLAQRRPATTPIGEVMSTAPFLSCAPDDDLRALERRMAQEKRSRALVQDELGKVVGVISLSDIAKAERSGTRVGKLMRAIAHRESALVARPSP
jgi:CBS domain-containing protein